MTYEIKRIQNKVDKEFVADKYKATLEMIKQCELGIKFLGTKEAQDLQGEKLAKEGILKYEETLKVKMTEKNFFEQVMSEKI